MNCSEFREILHDLDRPGTEGFGARDAAFLHAESCDRCTQLLTQSESLDFALRTLAGREARQQASLRVKQLLVEEFRRRNAVASRRRGHWPMVALGTAAALLLVLGLAVHDRMARRVPGTAVANGAGSKGEENRASVGVSESTLTPSEDGAELKEAGDFESETAFVSLPYADDSMAGEGGAIIRVVLSRPALASLGLPVADVGATDRIPADIIVSEDGAPQAIRLVRQSALE